MNEPLRRRPEARTARAVQTVLLSVCLLVVVCTPSLPPDERSAAPPLPSNVGTGSEGSADQEASSGHLVRGPWGRPLLGSGVVPVRYGRELLHRRRAPRGFVEPRHVCAPRRTHHLQGDRWMVR